MKRILPIIFLTTVILSVSSICPARQAATTIEPARFFLMGSGNMQLKNFRNQQEATIRLLNPDGSFNKEALYEVDRVLGFPTEEKGEHFSLRLIFMLSYFADQLAPGKTINIESAYRSPEYNDKIRKSGNNVARTSAHQDGLAVDFWLQGVDGKKIWETVKAGNCCGIGHYGGKIVHLDAGRPRFWEAATSGTRTREPDYNRHVYLSTQFDRYKHNDQLRLSFSGLSSFDFGVVPVVKVFRAGDSNTPVATLRLAQSAATNCYRIGDRRTARTLTTQVPEHLPAGRYRIQLEFCDRPFKQMPLKSVSNVFELID
ncbi:MAG: DUF882 domain-containing protein [Desulfobulbus oligotrophicus]|jgi:uncharacterized protein YcbK (DUF882 family)|nr:DUF882 domain-containing protein [Desulfobulbus oligotrophicus]